MSTKHPKSARFRICEDITIKGVDVTLTSPDADSPTLHVTCGFPFDYEMAELLVATLEQGLRRKGIICSHGALVPRGVEDSTLEHDAVITGKPASRCTGHRMLELAADMLGKASQRGFAGTPLGNYLAVGTDREGDGENQPDRASLLRHYWGVISKSWPRDAAHFFNTEYGAVPATLCDDRNFLAFRQQLLEDVSYIAAAYRQTPDFDLPEMVNRCVQTHLCEWEFEPDCFKKAAGAVAGRAIEALQQDIKRCDHGYEL